MHKCSAHGKSTTAIVHTHFVAFRSIVFQCFGIHHFVWQSRLITLPDSRIFVRQSLYSDFSEHRINLHAKFIAQQLSLIVNEENNQISQVHCNLQFVHGWLSSGITFFNVNTLCWLPKSIPKKQPLFTIPMHRLSWRLIFYSFVPTISPAAIWFVLFQLLFCQPSFMYRALKVAMCRET